MMGTSESKMEGDAATASASASAPTSAPPSPFALEMKSHLLVVLFTAIDSLHQGWLDRSEILTFIQHEPYLSSPHLQSTLRSLLAALDHDEDSHCSLQEFQAAFAPFPPADIARLIVNLIRRMPLPGRRLRKMLTMLESQAVREGAAGTAGQHGSNGEERSKCVYLLDLLFHSIDADLDGLIEEEELESFIAHDPFFTGDQQHPQMAAMQALWAAFKKDKAAGAADAVSSSSSPPPVSLTSRISGEGVTQDEFVRCFLPLSLREVTDVFVHLLTRTTTSSLTESGSAVRHAEKPVQHRQMLDAVMKNDVPAHLQKPVQLVHGGRARNAVAAAAAAIPAPSTATATSSSGSPSAVTSPLPASLYPPARGVRLTLLGQAMIQHDLRLSSYGRSVLSAIAPYLSADVVFTELETSIQPPKGGHAQRSTVFLHSAPAVVIDILKELGVNLLALANNHAGDMGQEGVKVLLDEVRKRGIVCAGLGMNEEEAAAAAMLTVTPHCWLQQQSNHGDGDAASSPSSPRASASPAPPPSLSSPTTLSACPSSITVALVAHASKIPPGSGATPTSPGVNSLSMSDLSTYTLDAADASRILASVSAARQHASIVIAYQHNHYWSGNGKVNEEHEMGAWKRVWAHALIDSGATIYCGHGDPRLQGIEIYNGCPVFFDLGSLFFQTKTDVGFYGREVWQSVIVTLDYHHLQPEAALLPSSPSSPSSPPSSSPTHPDRPLDPEREEAARTAPRPAPSFSIRLTPLTLNETGVPPAPPEQHFATRGLPSVAKGEEGRRILQHVRELSAPYGTEVEIEEGEDGAVIGWVTAGGSRRRKKHQAAAAAAAGGVSASLAADGSSRSELSSAL